VLALVLLGVCLAEHWVGSWVERRVTCHNLLASHPVWPGLRMTGSGGAQGRGSRVCWTTQGPWGVQVGCGEGGRSRSSCWHRPRMMAV
jgi:hypothetical protein